MSSSNSSADRIREQTVHYQLRYLREKLQKEEQQNSELVQGNATLQGQVELLTDTVLTHVGEDGLSAEVKSVAAREIERRLCEK